MPTTTEIAEDLLRRMEKLEIQSVQSVYLEACLHTKPQVFEHRNSAYMQALADNFKLKHTHDLSLAEIKIGTITNQLIKQIMQDFGYLACDYDNKVHVFALNSDYCGFFQKKHPFDTNKLARITAIATIVENTRYGTCEMQSSLAYELLKQQTLPNDIIVELVAMDHYDHVFIIIGRDPNSSLQQPSTWNIDACIIDPYCHTWYLPSTMEKNLNDLLALNAFGSKTWCGNKVLTDIHVVLSSAETSIHLKV